MQGLKEKRTVSKHDAGQGTRVLYLRSLIEKKSSKKLEPFSCRNIFWPFQLPAPAAQKLSAALEWPRLGWSRSEQKVQLLSTARFFLGLGRPRVNLRRSVNRTLALLRRLPNHCLRCSSHSSSPLFDFVPGKFCRELGPIEQSV